MKLVSVDVETDGGIQGTHSLVSFGAVFIEKGLTKTFYGKVRPVSTQWIPQALAVSGFSREEHLTFDDPKEVFTKFHDWLKEHANGDSLTLISDNNGFDAPWINWYFLTYIGTNPFGWSSKRIGDMFVGATRNLKYNWKKHRKTKHTHNPVDDAKGNAEAVLYLFERYGIK